MVYKLGISHFPVSLKQTCILTHKTTLTAIALRLEMQVSSLYLSSLLNYVSHPIRQASGLRDNVPSFSSQNPSSGFDTRTDYSTGQSNVNLTERQGTDSGTNIANTGYNSSPLGQQYDQGTTTAQYDPSRFGGEGTEGGAGQKQYGGDQGIGTGVGHHESAGKFYLLHVRNSQFNSVV